MPIPAGRAWLLEEMTSLAVSRNANFTQLQLLAGLGA